MCPLHEDFELGRTSQGRRVPPPGLDEQGPNPASDHLVDDRLERQGVGEPVVEEVDSGLQTAVGGERVGRRSRRGRRQRLTVTGQPLDHRR
ncbi:MAG: hypothetical protein ACRDH5_00915 [bacterium]